MCRWVLTAIIIWAILLIAGNMSPDFQFPGKYQTLNIGLKMLVKCNHRFSSKASQYPIEYLVHSDASSLSLCFTNLVRYLLWRCKFDVLDLLILLDSPTLPFDNLLGVFVFIKQMWKFLQPFTDYNGIIHRKYSPLDWTLNKEYRLGIWWDNLSILQGDNPPVGTCVYATVFGETQYLCYVVTTLFARHGHL